MKPIELRAGKFGRRTRGAGVTLIELLVVIVIIGILVGLTLSGILTVREASRRGQCRNQLRQLGIGLNQYMTTHGVLPPGRTHTGFSPFACVLPYVEQTVLYNAMNFQDGALAWIRIDGTIIDARLDIFLCPSDRVVRGDPLGTTSYAGNRGVGVQTYGYNGAFGIHETFGPAAFSDGGSATVVLSEWIQGPLIRTDRDPRRSVFSTPRSLQQSSQLDEFVKLCESLDFKTARLNVPVKGEHWIFGEYSYSLYNHSNNPGGKSCTNGSAWQTGAWSAGSLHDPGAHAVFLDGHVSFIREAVAAAVWRAIGSRNGGEPLNSQSL